MAPDTPAHDPAARVLVEQLALVWMFADQHVLPQIDAELVEWEPSANTVGVHYQSGEWVADWPNETASPLPEPTVGWLLWHIEWWWGNAVRACRGEAVVPPDQHRWSGSVDGIRAAKAAWDEILSTIRADTVVSGLMPEDKPLWFVAGWVNFELTKNISEIGQLLIRRGNAELVR